MSEVELTPVRPAHEFDQDKLHKFMQKHVPGYVNRFDIQQFEGGQSNPTFLLASDNYRYVLRKQPPGQLLPSAHAVHREYRVMDALANTAVPVPKMIVLSDDLSIIGTKFYIMDYIEGRLFTKTALPAITKNQRASVYFDMAKILAALHAVDPIKVGLERFGRPGNYYGRQVARWSKQYVASQTEPIDSMDFLMEWLPENLPEEETPCIVHGDFRLGNMLLDEVQPKVVGVLDWELSTIGDGLADLGYWCQEYYGSMSDKPGMIAGRNPGDLGIPTEDELIRAYCSAAQVEAIESWPFYIAYNLFRSAGIIQGVYKRGLDGNASSETAMEYEGVARKRADLAYDILQSNGLC